MKLLLCLFVLFALKPIIDSVASDNSSSDMIPFHPFQHPIRYEVRLHNTSSPGYQKFTKLVGTDYAFAALRQANEFALNTISHGRFIPLDFFPRIISYGKGYTKVILSLESFYENKVVHPSQVASTKANEIRVNLDYLNGYVGDLRAEFSGILYHESTRVWQWTGNGTAPDELISGVADYVRLNGGWPSKKWVSRGSGSSWNEGYAVTAYFLEYCSGLNRTFVADLNAKMKESYCESYFKDLLGKSVFDLWYDYKSLYGPLRYEVVANGTTQGDIRFKREVGSLYTSGILQRASEFALKALNSNVRQYRPYKQVKLIVESFTRDQIPETYRPSVASTAGSTIRLNSNYIQNFIGDLKADVTGIVYHESTHVWQWTGNGTAPIGLVNGVADYVRLKAGWPSRNWPKRGSGTIWNEGYAVTAYFLEYCESLMDGFVARLNMMMKDAYSPSYFSNILGKDVKQLWKDYKSAHAGKAPSPAAAAAPKAPTPAASPKAAPPVPEKTNVSANDQSTS